MICNGFIPAQWMPAVRTVILQHLLYRELKGTLEPYDPVEHRRALFRIVAVHAEISVSDKLEAFERLRVLKSRFRIGAAFLERVGIEVQ